MRKLYIKQAVFKITDHYPVTDAEGHPVYQVDQDFKFIGNTVHVSTPEGEHLFTVDREILTFLPRYTITFANGQTIHLNSRFSIFHKSIDVDPEGEGIELEGDFLDLTFTVTKQDRLLGTIDRAFLSWGDSFELTVHDERYEALFVAIVIAVDCIIDSQQNS